MLAEGISKSGRSASLTGTARAIPGRLKQYARRRPLGAASLVIVVMIILMPVLAPVISPYDPLRTEPAIRRTPPSTEHWMGADSQGRDILSRIIYGSRLSLMVGAGAVLLGTVFGSLWGLISGYMGSGSKLDLVTQRGLEVWMSFPAIILAMSLLLVLGAGVLPVIIAIGFTRVPYGARVIRSVVLSAREFTYVDAARAIGASDRRIVFKHILPNCIPSFLVLVSAHIGVGIIMEATLGFLGVGLPPPNPSWGNMLSASVLESIQPLWWVVVYPGLAIVITVLAFNLLGDAIRDEADPRLRGAG